MLLLTVLAGCTSEANAPTAAFEEVFVRVDSLVLEEPPGYPIAGLRRLSLAPDGRIVAVDFPSHTVRVHHADGSLEAVVGRYGDGPGEFTRPLTATISEDGYLYSIDSGRRVSRFTPDLDFDTLFHIDGVRGAQRMLPLGEDVLIQTVGFRQPGFLVLRRYSRDGHLLRKFHEEHPTYHTAAYWSADNPESIAIGRDAIYLTHDKIPLIYRYSLDGESIDTFGVPPSSWKQASEPRCATSWMSRTSSATASTVPDPFPAVKSTPRTLATAALLFPIALAGCGDAATAAGWGGTMTTLDNGAVLVSNPAIGIWGEDGGWTLTEELRIGRFEGEGPDLFGDIYGIVGDGDGRIWVLDRQAKELRVFDAEGRHLRTMGREGGGPEEFRDPIGLDIDPQGRVWVVDPGNARYSLWNPDGTHAENRERPIGGYMVPWPGLVDRDGRLLDIGFGRAGQIVLRFDDTGEALDTIPLPRHDQMEFYQHTTPGGGSISANVPFTPGITHTLERCGYLWSGRSESYRVVQQDLSTGDTVRIVEREWQPARVTREDREQALENLEWFTRQGGRVDAGRIPSTKPAFTWIMVDDLGHLWIAPPQGEGEPGRTFDLFDPEGRFLGTLTTPVAINRRYTHFAGDHLYTVATDEMDVPYVVRMRIERG